MNTKKVNFNQNLKIIRRCLIRDNPTWCYLNYFNLNIYNNDAKETYLHAAAMKKYDIFKLILDYSCIDINAKNSRNETPLMIACQYLKRKNVELLFKKENLDFHCRNAFNRDALDCVNNSIIDGNGENEKALNDALTKEQYFGKLMNKIAIKKRSYLNGEDDY